MFAMKAEEKNEYTVRVKRRLQQKYNIESIQYILPFSTAHIHLAVSQDT
jgi:hypothetical protein